jgi:hypothetical protein
MGCGSGKGETETPATAALMDSLVVCESCAPELLAAKTRGILTGMKAMVDFIGYDILPQYGPVTFHLSNDEFCGEYKLGMTGFARIDDKGKGHVCLFDVEKQNRIRPFTVENGEQLEDQLLPIHEAGHVWFFDRSEPYGIQEPFVKILFFILSSPDLDHCDWFIGVSYPDALMDDLCALGITDEDVAAILAATAETAEALEGALTNSEFADIVSNSLGKDARPAFVKAGLL